MNSDIFNFKRFARYFKSDVTEACSNYGLSLLVMSSMPITIAVITGVLNVLTSGQWESSGLTSRILLFLLFFIITCITAPSKLYGSLTDKKEGTAFILIPASRLEKYLSMLIICCILVPVLFLDIYLALDFLVCAIDPTLASSDATLLSFFHNIRERLLLMGTTIDWNEMSQFIKHSESLVKPWMYIDDMMSISLAFLLGAITFKKSKVSKTIGCLIVISIVLSMIATPLITRDSHLTAEMIEKMEMTGVTGIDDLIEILPGQFWALNHLVLIDTINDILWIVGLLTGIWFRLKNMKH